MNIIFKIDAKISSWAQSAVNAIGHDPKKIFSVLMAALCAASLVKIMSLYGVAGTINSKNFMPIFLALLSPVIAYALWNLVQRLGGITTLFVFLRVMHVALLFPVNILAMLSGERPAIAIVIDVVYGCILYLSDTKKPPERKKKKLWAHKTAFQ